MNFNQFGFVNSADERVYSKMTNKCRSFIYKASMNI